MKLKKINLKKVVQTDEGGFTHPEITTRKWYLAKVGGSWTAGRFSREWYGLDFSEVGQFDPPGENESAWQELYEIVSR